MFTTCPHSQARDGRFTFGRIWKRRRWNLGALHKAKGRGWDTGMNTGAQVEFCLQPSCHFSAASSLCQQVTSVSLVGKGKFFFFFSYLKVSEWLPKYRPHPLTFGVDPLAKWLASQPVSRRYGLSFIRWSHTYNFLPVFKYFSLKYGQPNIKKYLKKALNMKQKE